MTKKDSKYVSSETSEIRTIAARFSAPAPLLFFMQNEMAANKGTTKPRLVSKAGKFPAIFKPAFTPGKVLRTEFYSILELMGYKKQ